VIEVPEFRFRKAGDSRAAKTERQWFPASATFHSRGFGKNHCTFLIRSGQGSRRAFDFRSVHQSPSRRAATA
jgi:hypothetical protein